jgi:hypothetical protein
LIAPIAPRSRRRQITPRRSPIRFKGFEPADQAATEPAGGVLLRAALGSLIWHSDPGQEFDSAPVPGIIFFAQCLKRRNRWKSGAVAPL